MRWLAVALLLAPTGALGASGKVGKAIKALDKFDAGDRGALDTARAAADQATAHAKSEGDPEAWAIRGRAYLLYLTNPDLPRPEGDPAALAVASFEEAVDLGATGALHGQLSKWVPVLESTVATALLNDVEGKQWEAASQRLDLALRVRALGEALGGRDDQREAEVRRLAVQVTAHNGDHGAAIDHYRAFLESFGRHDPGLAGLVARELAGAGDLSGALAFLTPLDEQLPDDERLLRTEVELLRDGGRLDEAVARIDRAAPTLRTSVSGAFLAASLFEMAGADERARELWAHTLSLDARHFEAQLLLGQSLLDEAVRLTEVLDTYEATEVSSPDDELQAMADELADLWVRITSHLEAARELDSQRPEPLEALIAAMEARLGLTDPDSLRGAERQAHEADVDELDRLRSELSTLGD